MRFGISIINFFSMLICHTVCAQNISADHSAKAVAAIDHNSIVFKNKALTAVWIVKNGNISLKEIHNEYDHTTANLEKVILFAIETVDGKQLTNTDFTLQGKLVVSSLAASDSLPTASLHFAGKEISGIFLSADKNIFIRWSAQIRDGSDYLRQNIEIKTIHQAVRINKITFFDGRLPGAVYEGSVLGSPIMYKNFFFGLEHPIAHSKALFVRTVGSLEKERIDLANIISESGHYVVAIEHGGGPDDFNIDAISLLEDNNTVSIHKHVLNGHKGSSLYDLVLPVYNAHRHYTLLIALVNKQNATGTIHLYKKTDGLLSFYVNRTDTLYPGKVISECAVTGVSSPGQLRRSFLAYVERERARPYKQFLHYNCWWDITDDGASSFTSAQFIQKMHAWNKKFIQPFHVKLDAFVFDAGWDDPDSVWYFNRQRFPNGFAAEAALCREYHSGIGVWMSPFGGYLEDKDRRIASAKREGLETNTKGLSLAGPNYFKRFYERAADMLTNYKVNYFKFDGFGGSEPAYLPDMEAGAQLVQKLRKLNKDVYINLTVGSWPSPFWLKYADCTWRGSGDLHNAGLGNTSQRFMTYRDGTLHNNIVNRAPFYPLNSIMVAGIAYANLGHPAKFITEDVNDFKDMVRSFFGAGSSLQELYISEDKMKDEFWPILAEATKWAKENATILKDVHWVGGSPINLEVYGFASWKPGKGIITLRNPDDKEAVYDLYLDKVLELPVKYDGNYQLKSPWLEDRHKKVIIVPSNTACKIKLKPFEVLVLEAVPLK